MSKHVIGSVWLGINSQNDKYCYILLSDRNRKSETWMWKIVNKDDKIIDGGITNSYNSCLKYSNFNSYSDKKVIFSKIK